MTRPRFHLDENLTTAIAVQLRDRDLECSTPKDVGLLSAEDPDHLAFARREGRILITSDTDFISLHAEAMEEGEDHAGIIYFNKNKRHFGMLIRDIDDRVARMDAEDFRNRLLFL